MKCVQEAQVLSARQELEAGQSPVLDLLKTRIRASDGEVGDLNGKFYVLNLYNLAYLISFQRQLCTQVCNCKLQRKL